MDLCSFWLALADLFFSLHGVGAHDIVNASLTTLSSASSETNTSYIPSTQSDIPHNNRSLSGIIQSCFATIIACTWFAVHRNIPKPEPKRPRRDNKVIEWFFSQWYTLLKQKQPLIVFVAALLMPEWILSWAVRQAIVARRLALKLETARTKANDARKARYPELYTVPVVYGDSESDSEATGHATGVSSSGVYDDTRQSRRLDSRQPKDKVLGRKCKRNCAECGAHCPEDAAFSWSRDAMAAASRVGKGDERESDLT